MQGLYSIGDFSKVTGISVDTLRFYDKISLLKPEYIDPNTNYRYYSYPQLVKLDIIKVCRSMGLSLEHTAELFAKGDPAAFEHSLAEQQTVLQDQIRSLKESEKLLGKLLSRMQISAEVERHSGFYTRTLPARKAAVSEKLIDFSKDELHNAKVFIALTEDLRRKNIANNYEGGYVYGIKDCEIDGATMFEVVLSDTHAENLRLETIRGGDFFCMNYNLPERGSAIGLYLEEIQKRGLDPHFILDIYLIDGTFNSANRQFELQCPLGGRD